MFEDTVVIYLHSTIQLICLPYIVPRKMSKPAGLAAREEDVIFKMCMPMLYL